MGDFLVAQRGESVRACVGIERFGDVALLRSLCVIAEDRTKGYGTRALSAIEQRARAAGIEHLYLLTTTAAEFFGAHGYIECERAAVPPAIVATPEFESMCPASAACLSKAL
jgi:amino-acid N-acetyltransferase